MDFKLQTKYKPAGDQAQAIKKIAENLKAGKQDTTLLGVTGSGKTFTVANVVAELNRPTLVLSHNKTLAAQLFEEYQEFFPDNAVKYFVSYYDYYQPEAYVPSKDLFIEKDADVNQEIERYRLAAANSLVTRRDVLIVASVSCIYNIGNPKTYQDMGRVYAIDKEVNLSEILRQLANLQYDRGDYDFMPGSFRLKGDTLEIFPPYHDYSIRIELFGETIERITARDPLTGSILKEMNSVEIYAAKNFVVPNDKIQESLPEIREDLRKRVAQLEKLGKQVEAQRLTQRTMYDLEMLEQTGFCSGIENYSRYFDGRSPGDPPYALIDYFPDDFITIIDESHITIPQVRGMYNGDNARKANLVQYGFRLPSAMDNRPLNFDEFMSKMNQIVYTSATPGDWELDRSKGNIVEQIIRPTGLLDPKIDIRPTENQIDDILEEINKNIKKKQRILVTTLTKKMAEELSNHLKDMGIKVNYLHSEIDTVERIDILRDLRLGVYDVVVGINLLREGIDLPEVSLVLILDADKEGFLRSARSLIQTIGRAARHSEGRVIMYADKMTDSMKSAISENNRRRAIQDQYNKEHGITPTTIQKDIRASWTPEDKQQKLDEFEIRKMAKEDINRNIKLLEQKMLFAAQNLNYEQAAEMRDQIKLLKQAI